MHQPVGSATPPSGRSSNALTKLKTAVLAPMPSASVETATSVNAGLFEQHPDAEPEDPGPFRPPVVAAAATAHPRTRSCCAAADRACGASRADPTRPAVARGSRSSASHSCRQSARRRRGTITPTSAISPRVWPGQSRPPAGGDTARPHAPRFRVAHRGGSAPGAGSV